MPNLVEMMAAKGRGTDTTVGHLTPGEFVIPREVLDNQPQLMSAIIKAFGGYAENMQRPMDWREYMVGAPEAVENPRTGAEEFQTRSAGGGAAFGGLQARDPNRDSAGGPSSGNSSNSDIGRATGPTSTFGGLQASDPGRVSAAGPSTDSGFLGPAINVFGEDPVGTALNDMVNRSTLGLGIRGLTGLMGALTGAEGVPGDPSGSAPGGRDPLAGLSPARREAVSDTFQGLTRPPEMTPPPTLNLSSAMTPLQQRAAIATRATQGSDSVYRSDEAKSYYKNLLMRSLMEPGGGFAPFGDILPVEQQYLQQILGTSYQPTTQSVLSAIAAA